MAENRARVCVERPRPGGDRPHRFGEVLPREESWADACEVCEREVGFHEGPHAARKYQFVARGIAEALKAVGAGSTHRDVALAARERARRLRVDPSTGELRFTAPYGSVRLADVDTLAQVDPGNPEINDGAFHLVRRHFDVQAFGVNAATGNAGDEMVEEHHEADEEENQTNGHQELFAVMTGHALFTIDGEEIDAPAGTIVFVRDPALLRAARATADETTIFMVGGPAGVPYAISRREASLQ
jgi:mannose-6-phosphate isomerase-like protein (cupin superfamily)